ncbi:MAG: hypothetical protein E7419_02145 [Ruminococcaceae bacterium]|nr:hypothetical protein [Oscillospiraceae bacterium]
MFKMIVAISLISVICEMFLSGSSFKKYISVVFGIFVLLIIIENIFLLDPVNIDTSILDKAEMITDLTVTEAEKELIDIYEKNIKEELLKNNISVLDVYVRCDNNLTITKIKIDLKDKKEKDKVLRILTESFGLDTNIISV